jgi:hypothetical protein
MAAALAATHAVVRPSPWSQYGEGGHATLNY